MSAARWYQVLLLSATVAIAVPSFAQDKAILEGDVSKVVNSQGVPIAGVVLKLENKKLQNESQGVLRTYSSDSEGLYYFFDLTPSDDYVISATADPSLQCWFPSIDGTQKYAAQKFSVNVGEKKYLLPPVVCEPQAVSAPAAPPTPSPSGGPADPTPSADGSPQQTSPATVSALHDCQPGRNRRVAPGYPGYAFHVAEHGRIQRPAPHLAALQPQLPGLGIPQRNYA